ncbi:MAG: alkaline phosphatase D family protein [Zoogloeaceae bacterium]|nr:alkaline phosphatase D family protein [Zoogloeaceae bacterium]MCK6384638.1 alkaline phosphatase D family protein [Rhodocyclaceae bacterium]
MGLDRRGFLLASSLALAAPRLWARPAFTAYPFTLGVASGAPLPDGVVLWTRLAPDPLNGGGLPPADIAVRWEIARDEAFRDVVRRGSAPAEPRHAHCVHVEADGLEPARWYWYRFMAGDAVSPAGRTRTAPAAGSEVDRLRLAFASCQQYEQGFYAAHRHMAAEDLDLVVFLGDYIYESSWGSRHVRKHEGPEPYTLEQYRNRYARYKSDPDLQRCHAAFPWLVTWDDHEVDNDYASDRSEDLDPNFLARRAAAYRAYWEHMPLRRGAMPDGLRMRLHGRHDFGRLARFHVLDGRQYRDHQACPRDGRGGGSVIGDAACPERMVPQRSLLGAAQEHWLHEGLVGRGMRWNILAQPLLMAQLQRKPAPERRFWSDGWDGYPAARARLLQAIAERKPANPVVIGGDVHFNCVADLKPDFDDPKSPVVAAEFCGTSITSQSQPQARLDALRAESPHIRLIDGRRRGYVTLELAERRCLAKLRTLDSEKAADSPIATLATFVVEDGRPGAQPA